MSEQESKYVDILTNLLNLDILESNDQKDESIGYLIYLFFNKYDPLDDLDQLDGYVELWLVQHFDISQGNYNFKDTSVEIWEQLFEGITNNDKEKEDTDYTEIILIIQLIISFCKINPINLQKLSNTPKIKEYFLTILDHHKDRDQVNILRNKLTEIYSMLLAVNNNTRQVLKIINTLPDQYAFNILENIGSNLNNLLFANQLIFKNHYHHIFIPINKSKNVKDCTIQFWLELNNISSNRIMTIGDNLILEIRDSKLCLCNQEFMLALFDNFNFETETLYHISLTYKNENNEWSLYINNELINSMILFDGSLPNSNSVEIGSIICAFKLYSLKIWSIVLSEDMIKFTNQLGPLYNPIISSNDGYWGVSNTFEDCYLQRIFITSELTNINYEEFLNHIKQLALKNVVLDYNIEETIDEYNDERSQHFQLHFDYEDKLTLGKCLYSRTDNIRSKLIATNFFKEIIYRMQRGQSSDELFQYTSLIITFCQDPKLNTIFDKSIGFNVLAQALNECYVENFKSSLSIRFLKLFLKFCGWEFNNMERSTIQNLNAYKHLILNSSLWIYHKKGNASLDKENLEVLRYLFFHLSYMLNDTFSMDYNMTQLKRLNTFQDLCFQIYYSNNPILLDLSEDISITLSHFITKDFSKENFKLTWHFVLLCLENNALSNISIFCDTLSEVSDHCVLVNDFKTLNIIPVHLLLHILNHFCHKKLPIKGIFRMLLQQLSYEETVLKKCTKKNGLRLIFSTLIQCNIDGLFEIVPMIFNFGLNKEISSINSNNCPQDQLTTNKIKLPFLILSINLVEWMVQNDILITQSQDLNDFICSYLSNLFIFLRDNNDSVNIKSSNILPVLEDLLITLTQSNNNNIYLKPSTVLIDFISDNTVENIKSDANIGKFSSNICGFYQFFDDNYLKHHNLKECNYLDLTFFKTILPEVISKLLLNESVLLMELQGNNSMIQDILELLDNFKSYYLMIMCDFKTIKQLYELLFICGEVINLNEPPTSKISARYHYLLTFYSKLYCWLILNKKIRWSKDQFDLFYTNFVKYQATIYGFKPHNKVSDISQFILFMSLYQLCKGVTPPMLINSTRALITFNNKQLDTILGHMYQDNNILREFLEGFLSCSDEIILEKINDISQSILNEKSISIYKGRLLEDLNLSSQSKMVSESDFNKKILERKQKYCNFIHSESKILNTLMIQEVTLSTNKTNKILWKMCNNFLVSQEEKEKILKNTINKLNEEMRHIKNTRSGITDKTMTIGTEENYERMRIKLVPLYDSNFNK